MKKEIDNGQTERKEGGRLPFYQEYDPKVYRIQIQSEISKNKDLAFNMPHSKSQILYKNLVRKEDRRYSSNSGRNERFSCYNYFFISIFISFICGLSIGVFLMGSTRNVVVPRRLKINETVTDGVTRTLNSIKEFDELNLIEDSKERRKNGRFSTVSFTGDKIEMHKYKKDVYPKGMTEDMKDILKDNKNHRKHVMPIIIKNETGEFVPNDKTVIFKNIYWGPEVENSLPQGYGDESSDVWERYIEQAEVIKMEAGCGRMQNRLVTFKDGLQACVRYRQNTDQIQGEIFSYYVARLVKLNNLAPSVVKIVDTKDKLWANVANDIAASQWSSNRAVVLTQYIPSLESASIPDIFKPSNRHLNKYDVYKIAIKENDTLSNNVMIDKLKSKKVIETKVVENFYHLDMNLSSKIIKEFVELAQWSDLIIFDYLTANLDRIVNNLFNFQWNINIMDGPAHNLARKMDSGLLIFLDNESGLLHGYRLLKKYNVYHSQMLDNLCVFRHSTVSELRKIYKSKSVGSKLSEVFHKKNNAVIRDILPPLPEKNAKILHERIGKVLSQIEKCEQSYSFK